MCMVEDHDHRRSFRFFVFAEVGKGRISKDRPSPFLSVSQGDKH